MNSIIKEHISFKNQIIKLAKADLVKTYRGAALGWFWAIIKPCITIFVYWFAFSKGIRSEKDVGEYSFFLWLIAGMVPWFYMSEMITQGTGAIRKYKYLINKMKFPISTISTFVSLSKFFVHICMVIVLILVFILKGQSLNKYILQLPVYMIFMFLFFTSWSLFSAPLAAISKDWHNLINSLITAIFWMSGILWDVSNIDNEVLRYILRINPVTFLSEGYRNAFLYKKWFFEDIYVFIGFLVILLLMLILSVSVHKKLKKDIPDVL